MTSDCGPRTVFLATVLTGSKCRDFAPQRPTLRLLIPVLYPGADILEVLDVAGNDCRAILDGMGGNKDVIPFG